MGKLPFNINCEKHCINIDSNIVDLINRRSTPSFIEEYVGEHLLSVSTDMILRRDLEENLACSPVHGSLFPNCLFEEIRLMNNEPVFNLHGNSSSNKSKNHTEKPVEFSSQGQDEFLALLVYFLKEQKELKSDLVIEAQFEGFCGDLLSLVSKEHSLEFVSEFCINLMNHMFEKTGYIYPINLPSIQSAGTFYRVSLTRLLPKACYLYLQRKQDVQSLELSKISKFYEQFISNYSLEDSQKEELKLKCESFFPNLFGDDIVIENNFVDMMFNTTTINDSTIKLNQVKCKEDTKKLFETCLILSKSLILLIKNILSDLGISLKKYTSLLQDVIPLHLMDDTRFKLLRNHLNKVYLVEHKINGKWEQKEILKVCNSEDSYLKEINYPILRWTCPKHKIIVLQYYESITKLMPNERVALRNIAKELDVLHKNNQVHCDLKPDHIVIDNSTRSGFRLLDFEFVVSEGEEVIGYTKGYHPPEYDCIENQECAIASKKADVYSLGLCMLHFMNNDFTLNRLEIPEYLNRIEDKLLREVLSQMIELNSSKRLSNASDIIRLLEDSMEDQFP